ncbi:hypothetical protein H4F26_05475 [Vibrio alginolyticus]|nr:hypothetical protein [Vibrio alginolyticus]ELB2820716.1 hypothetical protein [Vibrio alginolyticus]EMD1211759.1 hypothetical protein [Vibrio alginolyticus]EMD1213896.1 hypothetical protein [Vibrio alginolyticus]BCG19486.1 hypothetical protein HLBS07_33380 [Vibrio alginolyticus]
MDIGTGTITIMRITTIINTSASTSINTNIVTLFMWRPDDQGAVTITMTEFLGIVPT